MLVNMTSRGFWLGSQMTAVLSLRNRGSTAKSQPPARGGGRCFTRGSSGRVVQPFAEVGLVVGIPPQELERDLLGRQVVAVLVVGVIAPIARNGHELSSLGRPRGGGFDVDAARHLCKLRVRGVRSGATGVAGRAPPSAAGLAEEEVTVAGGGHPTGSREMSLVHATRMVWVRCNVEAQDQRCDFLPVGTFGRGVQQPEIGLDVTAIIVGDLIRSGWSWQFRSWSPIKSVSAA